MKKDLKKIIVGVFLINLMAISSPVLAQSSFMYSVRAQKTPTVNDITSYSDAVSIAISNMLIKGLYIKNSESHLYLAFRVEKNSSLVGIALEFDVDHDQAFADDIKVLLVNQSKLDGYFNQVSLYSEQTQIYFTGLVSDINYLGQTYSFYQFDIPLNPDSSPIYDMYINDPTDYMLGFDFIELMNNSLISWTRGNLGSENTLEKLSSNANSFYTMILAGPGKFAVPDFNPVTQPKGGDNSSNSSDAISNGTDVYYDGAAASPGFELVIPIITFATILAGRKIQIRRKIFD